MTPPRKHPVKPVKERRSLGDGRVQFLVYLPPELVRELKLAAVHRDTSASAIVEQAVSAWLSRRRRPPPDPDGNSGE